MKFYNRTDTNVYGYIFEALAPFSTVGNANNMRLDLQCVPVISAMHKRRQNRGKYQRLRLAKFSLDNGPHVKFVFPPHFAQEIHEAISLYGPSSLLGFFL